jgi:hypothetical protein
VRRRKRRRDTVTVERAVAERLERLPVVAEPPADVAAGGVDAEGASALALDPDELALQAVVRARTALGLEVHGKYFPYGDCEAEPPPLRFPSSTDDYL